MGFFNNMGASVSTELLRLITLVRGYNYSSPAFAYQGVKIRRFNSSSFYIEAQVVHHNQMIGHYTTFIVKYNDVMNGLRQSIGAIDFNKIHAMNLDFVGSLDSPEIRIRTTIQEGLSYVEKTTYIEPFKILNMFEIVGHRELKEKVIKQGYKFMDEFKVDFKTYEK